MSTSDAARKALASGEWREVKDAASGKLYYFNKKLNKTVWDLDKELQQGVGAQVAGSQQPRGASAHVAAKTSEDFNTLARQLVESGQWRKIEAPGADSSRVYFQHAESGETTRDLPLYLEIRAAVSDADTTSGAPVPSAGQITATEVRGKSGALLDEGDVLRLDDWVAMFLDRGDGSQVVAARRLLQQELQRTGQWSVLREVETRLLETSAERDRLAVALKDRDALLRGKEEELDSLRRIMYFGVEGLHSVSAASGSNSSRTVSRLPRLPDNATDASVNDGQRKGDTADRVEVLSALVKELQEKNRVLMLELEEAKRAQHKSSTCPACAELDPWKRLMSTTAGEPSATSSSRGLPPWTWSGTNIPAPLPNRSAMLAHPSGVDRLPRHLTDPYVGRNTVRGAGFSSATATTMLTTTISDDVRRLDSTRAAFATVPLTQAAASVGR